MTLVQEHCKGNITVENIGQGACFIIKLPLTELSEKEKGQVLK